METADLMIVAFSVGVVGIWEMKVFNREAEHFEHDAENVDGRL